MYVWLEDNSSVLTVVVVVVFNHLLIEHQIEKPFSVLNIVCWIKQMKYFSAFGFFFRLWKIPKICRAFYIDYATKRSSEICDCACELWIDHIYVITVLLFAVDCFFGKFAHRRSHICSHTHKHQFNSIDSNQFDQSACLNNFFIPLFRSVCDKLFPSIVSWMQIR